MSRPDRTPDADRSADRRRIAVYSPDPLTALGLTALLRDGSAHQPVPSRDAADADLLVFAAGALDDTTTTTLRHLHEESGVRVLLLTNLLSDNAVRTAARCGVVAVRARTGLTAEELVTAVDEALATGAAGLNARLTGLLDQLERVDRDALCPRGRAYATLAGRELVLLRMLADGHDTAEIAEELGCAERTVKNIVQTMLARLGLRNRTHAVAHAIRGGLL
ncbi:LuxR C-terminal-related transcriptional regulator [Lentzea sp. NPDC058436]|uniref:helix-turn-helix transcriptional regulator n=1 Tax=Lentzea sp. NPDC058436 TaxID=3346499 RepID=UPI00364C6900